MTNDLPLEGRIIAADIMSTQTESSSTPQHPLIPPALAEERAYAIHAVLESYGVPHSANPPPWITQTPTYQNR